MNTILISGRYTIIGTKIQYDINVWAQQDGATLELIHSSEYITPHYNELWKLVKENVVKYYSNELFFDGAYTQYLDHLFRS